MSMTNEERIAAGWVRLWGLYSWDHGTWLAADGQRMTSSTKPGARMLVAYTAMHAELRDHSTFERLVVRPVWRRSKRKAGGA